MSAKRILIFSLAYFPKHIGGAEVAIKEITDRIAPADTEFHMICLRFDATLPRVEQVGNVLVHRIGFTRPNPSMADLSVWPLHLNKYLYQFYATWVAHKLHTRYHYDGIWAMMAHSCGIPAALFKLLHPTVGYVQTLQEGDPPEHIERLMRPVQFLFRRAFTTPTVIQVISNYLGVWAHAMGATCPIELVPNGVDTEEFTATVSSDALTGTQKVLGKGNDDIFLVTTSRLVHKNAVDDVLRALVYLPEHVKFAVLGIGPDESALRELARTLNISDRVRFVGQVDHSRLVRYLKACDIFIRPSRSEGMGISFIEAMAAGLPVIATQEGGIADFLFDAHKNPDKPTTGWAVRKDTPHDIAAAVDDIRTNPDKVREIIKNARELARTKYDWNLIARDMQSRVFRHIPTTQ